MNKKRLSTRLDKLESKKQKPCDDSPVERVARALRRKALSKSDRAEPLEHYREKVQRAWEKRQNRPE